MEHVLHLASSQQHVCAGSDFTDVLVLITKQWQKHKHINNICYGAIQKESLSL